MKKFRSVLSLVLCLLVLVSAVILPASAQEVFPESEHYKNRYYGEWEYTYPENTDGLYITFSEDTYTEEGQDYDIFFEPEGDITLGELIEKGESYKTGDYISIFNENDELLDVYQGYELAGRTIYIEGSSFKITLTTDRLITSYGFKIDNITHEMPDGTGLIRYHFPDGSVKADMVYSHNGEINSEYNYVITDGEAVIGWTLPDGGEYIIGGDEFISIEVDNEVVNLYAISTPVYLDPEDVYSFTNSNEYFSVDDEMTYYLTKKDHLRLVATACMVGGFSPLAIPATILASVLIQYPYFDDWDGSCIGFSTTVCLQKAGVIDVVKTQPGAKCVRDLKPTKDLISLLNYYNAQASAAIVAKNKAVEPGAPEYARQLKKMVDTVKQGKYVMMEMTLLEEGELVNDYHGVVITGCYERPDGSTVLLIYDENSEDYANGKCDKMLIAPDFSCIYVGYYPPESTAILWTADFDTYKALDINSSYPEGIFVYWIRIIKHIIETLRDWFNYYGLDQGFKIK